MKALRPDIAVIGGGLGGCAAALAAVRLGRRVVVTEETVLIFPALRGTPFAALPYASAE